MSGNARLSRLARRPLGRELPWPGPRSANVGHGDADSGIGGSWMSR